MLDSGLGGLTVLSALRALARDVDVLYFADTAHVPYGDRTLEDVAALGATVAPHAPEAGFALVELSAESAVANNDWAAAAAALQEFHCYNLAGRYITVTEARPPQERKGQMSEGFDLVAPAPFRPGLQRNKTRRRSPRPSPPRAGPRRPTRSW